MHLTNSNQTTFYIIKILATAYTKQTLIFLSTVSKKQICNRPLLISLFKQVFLGLKEPFKKKSNFKFRAWYSAIQ